MEIAKKTKRHWQEPKLVQMTNRFKVGEVSRQIHKYLMSLGLSREQALHGLECDDCYDALPIIITLPDGVTYNPDSEFVVFDKENFLLQKIDECDLFVYINAGNLQDIVDFVIAHCTYRRQKA